MNKCKTTKVTSPEHMKTIKIKIPKVRNDDYFYDNKVENQNDHILLLKKNITHI